MFLNSKTIQQKYEGATLQLRAFLFLSVRYIHLKNFKEKLKKAKQLTFSISEKKFVFDSQQTDCVSC